MRKEKNEKWSTERERERDFFLFLHLAGKNVDWCGNDDDGDGHEAVLRNAVSDHSASRPEIELTHGQPDLLCRARSRRHGIYTIYTNVVRCVPTQQHTLSDLYRSQGVGATNVVVCISVYVHTWQITRMHQAFKFKSRQSHCACTQLHVREFAIKHVFCLFSVLS